MEKAAVAKIDFGGFNLPFFEIFMPGAQLTHHENTVQKIEIAADG